jgi:uncharacterized protein DUF6119
VKSASTAGVLMLKHSGRVLACAFGHGHALIDEDKRENDFGLIVAANALSDENVRLVEKANLGSVIRDATQAAGITNLQEFNVDRALSLVRKLSGNRPDDASVVSGASSVTTTSEHDFESLHVLADALLTLYGSTTPNRYIIGDQEFFKIPGVPGKGFEICDIFDVDEKRLIHVKKSGRRSSVISHFINQGMNSAKALRTYGKVKNDFLKYIEGIVGPSKFKAIEEEFPHGWTVEFKFGDAPTHGKYAIPFFSRVTLDEAKREIEALGYKAVDVSFIRLSKA